MLFLENLTGNFPVTLPNLLPPVLFTRKRQKVKQTEKGTHPTKRREKDSSNTHILTNTDSDLDRYGHTKKLTDTERLTHIDTNTHTHTYTHTH